MLQIHMVCVCVQSHHSHNELLTSSLDVFLGLVPVQIIGNWIHFFPHKFLSGSACKVQNNNKPST